MAARPVPQCEGSSNRAYSATTSRRAASSAPCSTGSGGGPTSGTSGGSPRRRAADPRPRVRHLLAGPRDRAGRGRVGGRPRRAGLRAAGAREPGAVGQRHALRRLRRPARPRPPPAGSMTGGLLPYTITRFCPLPFVASYPSYGTSSRAAACSFARSPRRSYPAVVVGLACPASCWATERSAPSSRRSPTYVRRRS